MKKELTVCSGDVNCVDTVVGENMSNLVLKTDNSGKILRFEFKTSNAGEGTIYSCNFGISMELLRSDDYKDVLDNKLSTYSITERQCDFIRTAVESNRKYITWGKYEMITNTVE